MHREEKYNSIGSRKEQDDEEEDLGRRNQVDEDSLGSKVQNEGKSYVRLKIRQASKSSFERVIRVSNTPKLLLDSESFVRKET